MTEKGLEHDIHIRVGDRVYSSLKRRAAIGSAERKTKISLHAVARALISAYLEDPMDRLSIPSRRQGITVSVLHAGNSYLVTYNFLGGRVVECFCSPDESNKTGTDLQAILSDSCIAVSKLLQLGETLGELVGSFGENRNEGESTGAASSPLGAIVRAGLRIERDA